MVALEDLKQEAKNVLEGGTVKYIIGYKKPAAGFMAVPAFFHKPEDLDALVWDPTCFHNLVLFLKDEKKRKLGQKEPDERPVGIVVKGCDSRAVNVLLQENYIDRENVYILGVSCGKTGMVDLKKVRKYFMGKIISQIDFNENESFTVTTTEGKVEVPATDIFADRCTECRTASPVIHDVLLGEDSVRTPENPFGSLEEMENKSQEQKWDFWQEQLTKCIRCYACRSICPMCYCDECVVDTINFAVYPDTPAEEKAQKIKWVEKSPTTSENFIYHMVRAIHLAGRCVDCAECERACPVDIPLRFLNKKLEKESKELFDYDVGYDIEIPALISSFRDEDPEDFIR